MNFLWNIRANNYNSRKCHFYVNYKGNETNKHHSPQNEWKKNAQEAHNNSNNDDNDNEKKMRTRKIEMRVDEVLDKQNAKPNSTNR